MTDDVTHVVEAVLSARKYASVCRETVAAVATQEVRNVSSVREAVKRTKRKLHQIGGAYLVGQPRYAEWLSALMQADPDQARQICQKAMASHASSRERLPELTAFAEQILTPLAPIRSVVDIACGLNPLAAPWMPLAAGATYYCCDIYRDMMDFLGQALPMLGLCVIAEHRDALTSPPGVGADVTLLLKSIPCLLQVDRGKMMALLRGLRSHYIIVSFPLSSLGGRSKGMLANYRIQFARLAGELGWQPNETVLNGELVYTIERAPSEC